MFSTNIEGGPARDPWPRGQQSPLGPPPSSSRPGDKVIKFLQP